MLIVDINGDYGRGNMRFKGRIVEEQKTYYCIDTGTIRIKATIKGTVKKQVHRLLVGDVVECEIINEDSNEGIITALIPRTNQLNRPAVANLDLILFVNTLVSPLPDMASFDRFIFTADVAQFPLCIVFNKVDLLKESECKHLEHLLNYYKSIGYDGVAVSAHTGYNIDTIVDRCTGRVAVLAGPSGVGKSTLVSKLIPGRAIRVQELSKQVDRGKHTTTHTILLPLKNNGYIADTPGFSFLKPPKVPAADVKEYFPDFVVYSVNCKFSSCLHDQEPDCAVRNGVKNGIIPESRYKSYVQLYREMREKSREY